jgi:hypothetical protein
MYQANCSCLLDIKVCVSKEAATQVLFVVDLKKLGLIMEESEFVM